ncbi:MAG: non-homologous end-joining DNA ligase, partial [Acidimicrobiia bacterium]
MLATQWPRIFAQPDWVYELKWDGVRVIHTWDGSTVRLRSRRGNDATSRYPEVAVPAADRPLVLDGEVVSLDPSGRPSFQQLQQRMNLAGGARIAAAQTAVPVVYVVFDVLYDGEEVIAEPWERRRRRLEALDLQFPLQPSTVVDGDPTALWELVKERGLEGIVAKHRTSVYRPGIRSTEWRKITRFRTARAVVGGWLPGERARAGTFGSLLLGLWTDDGLQWVGAVGSGFSDASLAAIRAALDQMRVERSPFLPDPAMPRNAVWVEPALVAMVQYKDFTDVGRL